MKKRLVFYLTCACMCLFIGLPVFAADLAAHPDVGFTTGMSQHYDAIMMNTLTAPADQIVQAAQKNDVDYEANTMTSAPADVAAGSVNCNNTREMTTEQANIAQCEESAVQADGKNTLTVMTQIGKADRACILSGVFGQKGIEAMRAMNAEPQDTHRCMIAGGASIQAIVGMITTDDNPSGHGVA